MEYIEFTQNMVTIVEIKKRTFMLKLVKFFILLHKYLKWKIPLKDSFKSARLIFKDFEFKGTHKRIK